MFLPLQLAATRALQLGKDWHNGLNNVYAKRRSIVMNLLASLKCKVAPNQAGMFVWAEVPAEYKDGYALSDEVLYGSNVFITPGGIFGKAGEKYVRVSLCSTEENLTKAIERIQKVNA
jgi:LL-diaminopimelate aminotransferase